MKKYLFFNTVSPELPGLAIFDEKGGVFGQSGFVGKNELLAESLSVFFKKNKIVAGDFSAVLVICGPGSFSASRAGVVAANAMEFLFGVPVLGAEDKGLDFSAIISHNLGKLKKIQRGSRAEVFYKYPPNITPKKDG
jgi:hypothetical protein